MKSVFFVFIFVLFNSQFSGQDGKFDHSLFDSLLKKYVNEDGMVNYEGFRSDNKFILYLELLASADLNYLGTEEKLAFFINAYNAFVIKNVIDHYPISSPKDVKGFFTDYYFDVAGLKLSLDAIEYEYVLKTEPVLAHFGLVCGAKSCPKLIRDAYTGDKVILQLTKNSRTFISTKEKNYLDRENRVLYLSQIFNWSRKSFERKYGSLLLTAMALMNFDDKNFLQNNEIEIKFLDYNWELNSQ